MNRPSLHFAGALLAVLLGLVSTPLLFFAFAGNYAHTFSTIPDTSMSRLIAGVVGAVLAVSGIMNAARFRNAGAAGALTGVAGAVGEFVVTVIPWLAITANHRACTTGDICPYPTVADVTRLSLTVGIFSLVIATVAGYSLATLLAAVRHRMA